MNTKSGIEIIATTGNLELTGNGEIIDVQARRYYRRENDEFQMLIGLPVEEKILQWKLQSYANVAYRYNGEIHQLDANLQEIR